MKLQNKLLIWLFALSMAIGMLVEPLSAAAANNDDGISEELPESTHELLGYAVPIAEPEQPATIASSALLTILPSCTVTIKNLSCKEGSRICLAKGLKPIALTVSATGKAALVSEDGIPEGTQIFRSKLTNLNEVFSVTGLAPASSSQSYTLSLEKGKVYLRNQKVGSL